MANHDEGKRGSRAQRDDNVVVAVVGGGDRGRFGVLSYYKSQSSIKFFFHLSLYKLNYNWNLPIAQLELQLLLVYLFIYSTGCDLP